MKLRRILEIVKQGDKFYTDYYARPDARNRAFVRGRHWITGNEAMAPETIDSETRQYMAQQNEIAPALESKMTMLAPDDPAVKLVDMREGANTQNGAPDAAPVGRRQAAVLNRWALEDDLRATIKLWIGAASTYDKGGILRMEWSTTHLRPVVRIRMPWEVHWDNTARHPDDVAWYYERYSLDYLVYERRIKDGTYTPPTIEVKPDDIQPSLLEDYQDDRGMEQERRMIEPKRWVTIVEFWDVAEKKVYHILEGERHILSSSVSAIARPYLHLFFTQDAPQLGAVSDVTHASTDQRTINKLVSARDECVDRLAPKTVVDDAIFKDTTQKEAYLNSRMTQTSTVTPPNTPRSISDYFHTIPAAQLPQDFNQHLRGAEEHIRATLAIADFQRGKAANIRTAQEASMLGEAVTARAKEQAATLKGGARRIFAMARDYLKWAVQHVEESGLDIAALLRKTVSDPAITVEQFTQELLDDALSLVVMPFSPLMNDAITQETNLEMLLPQIMQNPALAMAFDPYMLAEEIVRAQRWDKSILIPREQWQQMVAAQAGPAAPPAPPDGSPLPPDMPLPPEGGVPPEATQMIQAITESLAKQPALA